MNSIAEEFATNVNITYRPRQASRHASGLQAAVAGKKPKVLWLELNLAVKTVRLQQHKRQKYQHLQEEALLRARGLLKNWENGVVVLTEDLYRRAACERDAEELMNYTPEALALRFNLRNDARILEAVKELWRIEMPRDALGCIDQRGYESVLRRIARCLDAEASRKRNKGKIVEQDWERDSRGEVRMSFANFFDSIFELADLWCDSIDADEYAEFLERLTDCISYERRGKRLLKQVGKVSALDADSDEDESSESSDRESDEESSSDEEKGAATRTIRKTKPRNSASAHFLTATSIRPATEKKLTTIKRATMAPSVPAAKPKQQDSNIVVRAQMERVSMQQQRRGSVVQTLEFTGDGVPASAVLGGRKAQAIGPIQVPTFQRKSIKEDDIVISAQPRRISLELSLEDSTTMRLTAISNAPESTTSSEQANLQDTPGTPMLPSSHKTKMQMLSHTVLALTQPHRLGNQPDAVIHLRVGETSKTTIDNQSSPTKGDEYERRRSSQVHPVVLSLNNNPNVTDIYEDALEQITNANDSRVVRLAAGTFEQGNAHNGDGDKGTGDEDIIVSHIVADESVTSVDQESVSQVPDGESNAEHHYLTSDDSTRSTNMHELLPSYDEEFLSKTNISALEAAHASNDVTQDGEASSLLSVEVLVNNVGTFGGGSSGIESESLDVTEHKEDSNGKTFADDQSTNTTSDHSSHSSPTDAVKRLQATAHQALKRSQDSKIVTVARVLAQQPITHVVSNLLQDVVVNAIAEEPLLLIVDANVARQTICSNALFLDDDFSKEQEHVDQSVDTTTSTYSEKSLPREIHWQNLRNSNSSMNRTDLSTVQIGEHVEGPIRIHADRGGIKKRRTKQQWKSPLLINAEPTVSPWETWGNDELDLPEFSISTLNIPVRADSLVKKTRGENGLPSSSVKCSGEAVNPSTNSSNSRSLINKATTESIEQVTIKKQQDASTSSDKVQTQDSPSSTPEVIVGAPPLLAVVALGGSSIDSVPATTSTSALSPSISDTRISDTSELRPECGMEIQTPLRINQQDVSSVPSTSTKTKRHGSAKRVRMLDSLRVNDGPRIPSFDSDLHLNLEGKSAMTALAPLQQTLSNQNSRRLHPTAFKYTCSHGDKDSDDDDFESCEAARLQLEHHNASPKQKKSPFKLDPSVMPSSHATIVLNAVHEVVLLPRRKEDDVVLEAAQAPPSRSQMMRRRYRCSFGKQH